MKESTAYRNNTYVTFYQDDSFVCFFLSLTSSPFQAQLILFPPFLAQMVFPPIIFSLKLSQISLSMPSPSDGWFLLKISPHPKKNTLLPACHVANLERIKYLPCFFLLPQVATRSTAPTVTLWNFNHHHGEMVMSKATHLMHEASWKSVPPLV